MKKIFIKVKNHFLIIFALSLIVVGCDTVRRQPVELVALRISPESGDINFIPKAFYSRLTSQVPYRNAGSLMTRLTADPVTSQQFFCTGIYSNGQEQDLTSFCVWTSSNPDVAVFSPLIPGLAEGVGFGSIVITASIGAVSAPAALGVGLDSITISPQNATIQGPGNTQQYTALGHFSDSSTQDITSGVIWNSTNTLVATIASAGTSSPGLATSVSAGSDEIRACVGTRCDSGALTVTPATPVLQSCSVTPTSCITSNGSTSCHYTATGTYSSGPTQDITSNVTWTSSDPSVATVQTEGDSNPGWATGQSVVVMRSATISASQGAIGCTSTTDNITVSPVAPTLVSCAVAPSPSCTKNIGETCQFTATGTYSFGPTQIITDSSDWSSSNMSVGTVETQTDADPGLATALSAGTTIISAMKDGKSCTSNFIVNPALVSCAVTPSTCTTSPGQTNCNYTATGTYSDSSTQDITALVTWASSDTNVATIDAGPGGPNPGQATGGATTGGAQATISASMGATPCDTPPTPNNITNYSLFYYVSNYSANSILIYDPADLTISGSPAPVRTVVTGALNGPAGLAFDNGGNLWVANGANSTLVKFTAAQLASGGGQTPTVLSSGSAGSIDGPGCIAFDPAGNLWVANFTSATVSQFTPTQLNAAGPQAANVILTNDAGCPSPGRLCAVTCVAFDSGGNLFASSQENNNVFILNAANIPTTPGSYTFVPDVSFLTGNFNRTINLVFNPTSGNLWVSNFAFGAENLYQYAPPFTPSSTPIVTITKNGSSLAQPDVAAFDFSENLWVANTNNNTLVLFTPAQQAAGGALTPQITISGGAINYPWTMALFPKTSNLH